MGFVCVYVCLCVCMLVCECTRVQCYWIEFLKDKPVHRHSLISYSDVDKSPLLGTLMVTQQETLRQKKKRLYVKQNKLMKNN